MVIVLLALTRNLWRVKCKLKAINSIYFAKVRTKTI